MKTESSPRRRLGVLFALAGLAFCVLAALGKADVLCVTSGCSLYHDWNILGYSLWWWGAGGFALIVATTLLVTEQAARFVAGAALALDIPLLIWMAIVAPCANCLIVGLFFLLTFVCLRGASPGRLARVVTWVWLLMLMPNLFQAASETAGVWTIHGPEESSMRVYFSPTCAVCIDAVATLGVTAEGAAFVPVSKSSEDVERLLVMEQAIEQGADFMQAFEQAISPTYSHVDASWTQRLALRTRLLRNQAAFRRTGARGVPMITMNGWAGPRRHKPNLGEPRPDAAPTPSPQEQGASQ